jgi:hypothetical protein
MVATIVFLNTFIVHIRYYTSCSVRKFQYFPIPSRISQKRQGLSHHGPVHRNSPDAQVAIIVHLNKPVYLGG